MAESKRISLAAKLTPRDGGMATGGKLTNCYEEPSPKGDRIIKRPGTIFEAVLGDVCIGQGAFSFGGQALFIACDTLTTIEESAVGQCALTLTGYSFTPVHVANYVEQGQMTVNTLTGRVWVVQGDTLNYNVSNIKIIDIATATLVATTTEVVDNDSGQGEENATLRYDATNNLMWFMSQGFYDKKQRIVCFNGSSYAVLGSFIVGDFIGAATRFTPLSFTLAPDNSYMLVYADPDTVTNKPLLKLNNLGNGTVTLNDWVSPKFTSGYIYPNQATVDVNAHTYSPYEIVFGPNGQMFAHSWNYTELHKRFLVKIDPSTFAVTSVFEVPTTSITVANIPANDAGVSILAVDTVRNRLLFTWSTTEPLTSATTSRIYAYDFASEAVTQIATLSGRVFTPQFAHPGSVVYDSHRDWLWVQLDRWDQVTSPPVGSDIAHLLAVDPDDFSIIHDFAITGGSGWLWGSTTIPTCPATYFNPGVIDAYPFVDNTELGKIV